MEIKKLLWFFVVLLVIGCGKPSRIDCEEEFCGKIPLFTLSPSFIVEMDSGNPDTVFLRNGSAFGVAIDLFVDGLQYNILGSDNYNARTVISKGGGVSDMWECRYSFLTPERNWYTLSYDDSHWESGFGPFGLRESCPTSWSSHNLYIRRFIECPEAMDCVYELDYCLNGEAVLYVNGERVARLRGNGKLQKIELGTSDACRLKTGRNLIAIKCTRMSEADCVADFGITVRKKSCAVKADVKEIYANSSVSKLSFSCGEDVTAELSFISPEEYFGFSPINYLNCKIVSNVFCRELELIVRFDLKYAFDSISAQKSIEGRENVVMCKNTHASLYKGTSERPLWGVAHIGTVSCRAKASEADGVVSFGFEKKESRTLESSIFVGYEEDYVVQLFGENIRPLWNNSGKRSLESLVKKNIGGLENKAIKSAAPASLRLAKANLRLGADKNGNLILVTSGYINRMTELYDVADIFSRYGEKQLVEALINPLVLYAESGCWDAPFCPPDLGYYPFAMHRITDDMDYHTITLNALSVIDRIDSLAGNSYYSRKHRQIIEKWRKFTIAKDV